MIRHGEDQVDVRLYWPEPAETRDKACGEPVVLVGELAYWRRHISRQGNAYATGVLRLTDGEIAIEIPPLTYTVGGGLLAQGERLQVEGRIDRRGPVHLVTVRDVMEALQRSELKIRKRTEAIGTVQSSANRRADGVSA